VLPIVALVGKDRAIIVSTSAVGAGFWLTVGLRVLRLRPSSGFSAAHFALNQRLGSHQRPLRTNVLICALAFDDRQRRRFMLDGGRTTQGRLRDERHLAASRGRTIVKLLVISIARSK